MQDLHSLRISSLCVSGRILVQVSLFTLCVGLYRDNLDPTSTVSDAKLWETLDMCHLKEVVTAAGGLGAKVSEGGESLSLGQRQLLCLARSLLGTARVSASKIIFGNEVICVHTY